jgi:DNA-binding transcriptional ArsR family regulator
MFGGYLVATSRADLILHPVRMRLILTLARRQLTARQLSELLPEIPQATLYHHLGVLSRAELLRVVSERPVRGTVEKLYALADNDVSLAPADLANASRDDQLRYFTVFVTTLLGDFARYLQQEASVDLLADGAGYREVPVYLSDAELVQFATALNRAVLPFLENQPSSNRRRRLFATVMIPDVDSAGAPDDTGPSTTTPEME